MIALIVAFTKNRVIGKDGVIPWNIKNEKQRFKKLTTGNVVIMGRKTYEEIGFPLPNRKTIIVSSTKNFDEQGCHTVGSLSEAIEYCKENYSDKEIYISGGAGLYTEAIPLVDKMYITEIDAIIEGDTYFPEFNEDDFIEETDSSFSEELPYTYLTYTRK